MAQRKLYTLRATPDKEPERRQGGKKKCVVAESSLYADPIAQRVAQKTNYIQHGTKLAPDIIAEKSDPSRLDTTLSMMHQAHQLIDRLPVVSLGASIDFA